MALRITKLWITKLWICKQGYGSERFGPFLGWGCPRNQPGRKHFRAQYKKWGAKVSKLGKSSGRDCLKASKSERCPSNSMCSQARTEA